MFIITNLINRMASNKQDSTFDKISCKKCHQVLTVGVKYLGCLHVFCRKCLSEMMTPESDIICHACRAKTQLDSSGIEGLPSCSIGQYAQLILNIAQPADVFCRSCKSNSRRASIFCLDCNFFLCNHCHTNSHMVFQEGHKKVLDISEMKGRNLDQILDKLSIPCCKDHSDQKACNITTDNELLCNFHDFQYGTMQPVSSVIRERHKIIHEKMQTSLKVAESMKSRLNDLSGLEISLKKEETQNIEEANDFFDNLVQCVEKRRAEVIQIIKMKSRPAHQNVVTEVEKQEKTIEKYFDAQEHIKWCLDTYPNTFLINDFQAIDWYLGHFNCEMGVKTATLKGLCSLDIPQFNKDTGLERRILEAGCVEGGKSSGPPSSPRALSPKPPKPMAKPTPTKRKMPQQKSLSVMPLADKKGQPVEPWEIACNSENTIYVLDRNSNKIHVFDRNGRIMNTLMLHQRHAVNTWGLSVGQFDKSDRIIVSDLHYKHILLMDTRGTVISIIRNTDKELFGHPTGVTIDTLNNQIAIVDTSLKLVHIFSSSPRFIRSLGGDEWLKDPTAICSDNKGNYIVLDTCDPLKFVMLNSKQNFVKKIFPPFEQIAIELPQCIIVNREGNLCWSDSRTHSIVTVREDGSLVDIFGAQKDSSVKFRSPAGICIDTNGNMIVGDALSYCLIVL